MGKKSVPQLLCCGSVPMDDVPRCQLACAPSSGGKTPLLSKQRLIEQLGSNGVEFWISPKWILEFCKYGRIRKSMEILTV